MKHRIITTFKNTVVSTVQGIMAISEERSAEKVAVFLEDSQSLKELRDAFSIYRRKGNTFC